MKLIKGLIKTINSNFKIKLGICIGLITVFAAVVISGMIYSNKINKINLSLKISTNKTNNERDVNKDKILENEKKEKIKLLKDKIRELDYNIDISKTENNLDKDLLFYENLYNDLLKKKEEAIIEDTNTDETIYNESIPVINGNNNESSYNNINDNQNEEPVINEDNNPNSNEEEKEPEKEPEKEEVIDETDTNENESKPDDEKNPENNTNTEENQEVKPNTEE
ncbi:hypothetical protein [Clostridium sp. C8]|uniref:hypothetical protein n=1 Tax=Clostridium sp. C8 TaxID=1667357 RepID=UPI00062E6168|nr:hypothetical protein [Clostridium sp. C8]KLE16167.1 hypothetical protein AAT22_07490 [Clostridium sp. C8]